MITSRIRSSKLLLDSNPQLCCRSNERHFACCSALLIRHLFWLKELPQRRTFGWFQVCLRKTLFLSAFHAYLSKISFETKFNEIWIVYHSITRSVLWTWNRFFPVFIFPFKSYFNFDIFVIISVLSKFLWFNNKEKKSYSALFHHVYWKVSDWHLKIIKGINLLPNEKLLSSYIFEIIPLRQLCTSSECVRSSLSPLAQIALGLGRLTL